jgi:hypothetical protein
VRLQRVQNRVVNGKAYWKFRISDIPSDVVSELGWKDGDELEPEVVDGSLRVTRAAGRRRTK